MLNQVIQNRQILDDVLESQIQFGCLASGFRFCFFS